MRITRETLLKIVQDTVTESVRANRSILSAYLCGSLLGEEPLLGGAGDIDLVFLHLDIPEEVRELRKLTEDIHLDISHHSSKEYRQARSLRTHPWLGPTIAECKILHDPQHFMDFTQASVRGQFNRADYVLQRARGQAEHARQIWLSFTNGAGVITPKELALYLKAIDHAVNAVASLSGHPLTERRYLLEFPARAEAVGRPGLYPGLLGLLGGPNADVAVSRGWLPAWGEALQALPAGGAPIRLQPIRRPYYRRAFDALLEGPQPQAVLWPLLRTWTDAAALLPAESEPYGLWRASMERLGLVEPAFSERVRALDAFLDLVEETLEQWAEENGA